MSLNATCAVRICRSCRLQLRHGATSASPLQQVRGFTAASIVQQRKQPKPMSAVETLMRESLLPSGTEKPQARKRGGRSRGGQLRQRRKLEAPRATNTVASKEDVESLILGSNRPSRNSTATSDQAQTTSSHHSTRTQKNPSQTAGVSSASAMDSFLSDLENSRAGFTISNDKPSRTSNDGDNSAREAGAERLEEKTNLQGSTLTSNEDTSLDTVDHGTVFNDEKDFWAGLKVADPNLPVLEQSQEPATTLEPRQKKPDMGDTSEKPAGLDVSHNFSARDQYAAAESNETIAEDELSVPVMDQEESIQTEDGLPESDEPRTMTTREERRKYGDELLYQREVGINALGRRVDALILRNPNKMTSSRKDVPLIERDQPAVPFDLKNAIRQPQEEEELDAESEYIRNIDELRPTDTTVLRPLQFEELQQTLYDGFTTHQLMSYMRQFPQEEGEDIAPYDWVFSQADSLGSDTWPEMSTGKKSSYVLRIMLRAWRLETHEEHEKVGSMRFTIRDDVWWLLSRQNSPLLKSIRQDFLGGSSHELIALHADGKGHHLVLRARRATVSAILARIDAVIVTQMTSTTLPIQESSELDLEAWGNLTQTIIERDGKALRVSWFPRNDYPAQANDEGEDPSIRLETPADVVYRLVTANQSQVDDVPHLHALAALNYVPYKAAERLLSARHKVQGKMARGVTQADPKVSGTAAAKLKAGWPSFISGSESRTMTATFGHLLWTSPGTKSPARPTKKDRQQKESNRACFLLPRVPHPAALANIMGAEEQDQPAVVTETVIILNFEHLPILGKPLTADKVLNVRLRIPLEQDVDLANFEIPSTATLNAVSQHEQGYPYPNSAVDASVKFEQLIPLDINDEPIQRFLKNSIFSLADGLLRTPSRTEFKAPVLNKSDGKPEFLGDERLPYLFTGLEVHQSVEMPWEGHTLRYNCIEAGLHGGQRQELSLVADMSTLTEAELEQHSRYKKFAKVMKEVVQSEHFSWLAGAKSLRKRSRPEAKEFEEWMTTATAEPISKEHAGILADGAGEAFFASDKKSLEGAPGDTTPSVKVEEEVQLETDGSTTPVEALELSPEISDEAESSPLPDEEANNSETTATSAPLPGPPEDTSSTDSSIEVDEARQTEDATATEADPVSDKQRTP